MGKEEDLLKVRSKYPKSSGWETTKAWLSRTDQVSGGVQKVLENQLIDEFVKYAGTEFGEPQKLLEKKEFSWSSYSNLFEKISSGCEEDLFSELIQTIYEWAKSNDPKLKTLYLQHATTPAKLVIMFANRGYLKDLLSDLIEVGDIKNSLTILNQTFEGIEQDPKATALLVLDFIYTIRDLSDDNTVLSAFFEGFEVRAEYGLIPRVSVSLTWKASPMLKAMANTKSHPFVKLYEIFIRDLFSAARRENSNTWGKWQRAYDQEFRFWTNVMQSGMIKSDLSFEYDD